MPSGITPFIDECERFRVRRDISGCFSNILSALRRLGVMKSASYAFISRQLRRRRQQISTRKRISFVLFSCNYTHYSAASDTVQCIHVSPCLQGVKDALVVAKEGRMVKPTVAQSVCHDGGKEWK